MRPRHRFRLSDDDHGGLAEVLLPDGFVSEAYREVLNQTLERVVDGDVCCKSSCYADLQIYRIADLGVDRLPLLLLSSGSWNRWS